jgi:hypothetical protein
VIRGSKANPMKTAFWRAPLLGSVFEARLDSVSPYQTPLLVFLLSCVPH